MPKLDDVKHVISGYSDDSMTRSWQFFKVVFPTSKIACTVQVGRNRLKYIVNFGLAPYIKDILKSEIAASEWFLISFNESSNKEIHDFEMNFVIHLWNSAISKVHFRFRDSMFFGRATAKDLAKNFCYGLS